MYLSHRIVGIGCNWNELTWVAEHFGVLEKTMKTLCTSVAIPSSSTTPACDVTYAVVWLNQ